jgi:hypothetical protein
MEIGEWVNEEWAKGRESALWLTELAMAGLRPGHRRCCCLCSWLCASVDAYYPCLRNSRNSG